MFESVVTYPEELAEMRRRRHARWRPYVALWLGTLVLMVFAMVVVGGATRLTESGLSIVEWKPVSGVIPPLSAADWQAEFAAYQQTPEYRLVNRNMTLGEFKTIYWWEYAHRLLGRAIGFVFILPFALFLWKRALPHRLLPPLIALFALGALQGAVGWWMVKSGLVDEPDVSQYRLAVHLGIAFVIFSGLLFCLLDVIGGTTRARPPNRGTQFLVSALLIALALQIVFGALVAGLGAGFAFNSWPLMAGALVPEGLLLLEPWYANFGENPLTVQFTHRMLGYLIAALALWLGLKMWRGDEDRPSRLLAMALLVAVALQVMLGIATLLAAVPVALGTLHQAGALVVVGVLIALIHRLRADRRRLYD